MEKTEGNDEMVKGPTSNCAADFYIYCLIELPQSRYK